MEAPFPKSLHALPALTVRVALVADAVKPYGEPITRAEDVWAMLRPQVSTWDRERFITLALDTAHRLLGIEEVSVGTLNSATVHPREVFKSLILANAHSFICVHNHPSQDLTPSSEDANVTERLANAGNLMGIRLLDHIIVCADSFYSFQASGRLTSAER